METLNALAHGFAQLGTGFLVGAGTETAFNYLTPKVSVMNKHPAIRLVVQFSVGFVVLGEVVRGLAGRGIESPIGDSLLIIAWTQPQTSMWSGLQMMWLEAASEVDRLEQDFKRDMAH